MWKQFVYWKESKIKETLRNIKIIYKYGHDYKWALILELLGSIVGIYIGIELPRFIGNQINSITINSWYELLSVTFAILIIQIISALKIVLIRKNTQRFTIGVTEKMQKQLSAEILKISQKDIDNNSTGIFV